MIRRRRRPPRSFQSILLLFGVGVALFAGIGGYWLGSSQKEARLFSQSQTQFIQGLIVGTKLQQNQPEGTDLRLHCASRFFPDQPNQMAGCVAGLRDMPKNGWKLPPP